MLLKLQNIGKIYNSNDILTIGIRGVNLELDYNEFVTIEGESGSGKSTLLNVIGANDSYEEGELYINGFETSHYSESEWEKYREKNIATVFQDFNIIENLTVLENVELALLRIDDKKERRRIATELIEKVGLTKQIKQRGSKLSGGEKQRTVIARALAKDAPIILADEPTGNLDVKSSREIAKLLKEVSKDKLVIVVTHNPEFFTEYATRRVTVFDGAIKEDKVIEKPAPKESAEAAEVPQSRKRNFINTLHIGILNYKSRPKFTGMMSFALFVCAIALFFVIAIFGQALIKPTTTTLDDVGVKGKMILSNESNSITQDELDEIAGSTQAGFYLLDRELSEFTVTVPKKNGMSQSREVICMYSPYEHNLKFGEGVLVLSNSMSGDAEGIKAAFLNADVGLINIEVDTKLSCDKIYLYVGFDTLENYGEKLRAVYSTMKLGTQERTVYTFVSSDELQSGEVNLINSGFYEADGKTAIFNVKATKSYIVKSSDKKDEAIPGLAVEMNTDDYNAMFAPNTNAVQSVLFYKNDDTARAAVSSVPQGYMGMLSTSEVFVQGADNIYTMNIVWYLALIAACLLFAALISVIFGRSVKIFQSDFTVYRTLGISSKISSRSLYIQMALIFLPTLVLLPIVSLIAALIPGSTLGFITVGNYFFIEIMLLIIVESVAFGFNRSIMGQSIRKNLRRGSK